MCSMAVGRWLMMCLLVWSMTRLGCHPACVSGHGISRFGVSQNASDLGGGLTLGGGPHALHGKNCHCRCAFLCLEWLVWSMARLGCHPACVSASLSDRTVAPRGLTPLPGPSCSILPKFCMLVCDFVTEPVLRVHGEHDDLPSMP